ncbi:MAG TPA: tRNA (adenosine(37)-N6)-dimethylallyltransferase MiaA [Pseudonocardiaceae bacterium]|nr:tRNA (adenosine(37)-N6)-dimethylallyltransferase MiaA [Pseudonocardiaceae bacterium]
MSRPVAIVGPTATGKTDLAVRLALAVGGEVLNADAMQLYRGMDIGTAKLPVEQRQGVPHHLFDVLDVTENASVAAYQRQARALIEQVRGRGAVPILAGGSGLYVTAVLDDLAFPGTDPALRAELEAELDRLGPAAMHARLARLDPAAAAAILPGNGRRIVRALEVVALTGKPFSAFLPVPGRPLHDAVLVGVDRETTELDRRIERRVEQMFDAGFVDEVQQLLAAGLREGRTASSALGYRQVIAALDGECSLCQAARDTVIATRRFVRRQRSWFRRDRRITWLDGGRPDLVAAVLDALAATGAP